MRGEALEEDPSTSSSGSAGSEQPFVIAILHYPVASGFEKVSPLILVVGLLGLLATIELYHQLLT